MPRGVTSLRVSSASARATRSRSRPESYRRKRREWKRGGVNFVEIDLLRAGRHLVDIAKQAIAGAGGWDYLVNVARAGCSEREVYLVSLRQRLPRIRIPLKPADDDAVLDLQSALNESYDKGPYPDSIDYNLDPTPPLRPEDNQWADTVLRQKGLQNDQAIEHRHDRLRLHGPGPLERVSPGQPVLPARASAGAEGLLRPQGRQDQGLCRELGLRVVRDRLAKAHRAEGHRRDRHRLAEQHAPGDRARRGQGRQDDPLRKAAGDERGRGRGDGARPSKRPACRTWSGSTIAACRPFRWPSRSSTKAASAGRSTIGPRTCRTGRSRPTCRRAARPCGGSTSTWPAPA